MQCSRHTKETTNLMRQHEDKLTNSLRVGLIKVILPVILSEMN